MPLTLNLFHNNELQISEKEGLWRHCMERRKCWLQAFFPFSLIVFKRLFLFFQGHWKSMLYSKGLSFCRVDQKKLCAPVGKEIFCLFNEKLSQKNWIFFLSLYQTSNITKNVTKRNAWLMQWETPCICSALKLQILHVHTKHYRPPFDIIVAELLVNFTEPSLTLSHTTNFRFFQTERDCRQLF